jgi:hypothetical protein
MLFQLLRVDHKRVARIGTALIDLAKYSSRRQKFIKTWPVLRFNKGLEVGLFILNQLQSVNHGGMEARQI